jgi:IPT/TIG domain-containing protein
MATSSFRNQRLIRCFLPLAGLLLVLTLTSCGGGSSSSGPGPGPSPSFSISVSPQNQSVGVGQSATLTLSVSAVNGFNQAIQVSVTGLPNGVTSSPASPFPMTISGQSVTLAAASSASIGSSTVKFNATSGSLSSSAQAQISVLQGPPGLPDNRTSLVRTDDTPSAVLYDPVHQLIFASAVDLNCVDVIPLATQQVAQCIPVSGALGLSLSADGTKVLVGTQVGIIAWIDPTTLQVVRRDVIPQIPNPALGGGFGFVSATQAFQVANGKLLLFSLPGCCDLGTFIQSVSVAEWDPVAGTSTARTDSGGGGVVSTTLDHSKLLVAGGGTATLYDSATDQFTAVPGVQFQFATLNPTGSQFVAIGGTPLLRFFNLQMQQVGSLNLPDCCAANSAPLFAVYSLDGKSLYLAYASQSGLSKLVTIDAGTFQVAGTAANLTTEVAYFGGGASGLPQAVDSTGLVFEVADHGVGIVDANDFRSFQNPQVVSNFIVATPDEGPLNQPTTTQFTTGIFGSLPDIFFGNQRGLNPVLNGPGQLQATAPPSTVAGPVNVKTVEANGVMAFIPQAFTYGSLPVQYGTLASDPRGGVFADLLGYGFSVDIPGANIQVSVGGSQAQLQKKELLPTEIGYPFPLQHLVVTIPSGLTGARDIDITSPSGVAAAPKAFHYVKSVVDFPSPDSFLYVLYDPHRDQLYLSATDHIDVFSLASHSFGSPIAVPTKSGTRLILGLALTPDGSKLLAANQSDQSVAIINPDNPTANAVAISVPPTPVSGNAGPFQIATTSTGHAFITLSVGNALSGGSTSIYDLDLSSLQVTTPNLPAGSIVNLNNNYIQASTDGTVVIEATSNNSGGPLLSWRSASNTWQVHLVEGQFWDNVAISGDGRVLAVGSSPDSLAFPFPYLLDPELHLTAQVNFPEFQSIQEGPTLQIDQSGALLYAVNGAGVDIMDARTGQLRERVLLAEQTLSGPREVLQTPSKAMGITPTGDEVFLLTTAGLTIVDLDSVPLGIGSVTPASGAAGSLVSIRGTGFVAGTSITVNGIPASTSFVDASTLSVTIPTGVQKGAVQFTLTNPDASKFSLDAAFQVQ